MTGKPINRVSFGVLLALAGTLLLSCAKEAKLPPSYTLSVETSAERTKALSLDESGALKASWVKGEEVKVYKTATGEYLGTLTAQSSGKSCTLSGTITGEISVGKKLSLDFLSADFTEQDGTLTGNYTSIDKVCDYAVAVVKVTSIDGGVVTTEAASFENRQAIVCFTLKHGDEDVQATQVTLTVSGYVYTSPSSLTITVTPPYPSSELYVAIPCYYDNEFSFSFQVFATTYPYLFYKNTASIVLNNGDYRRVTVALDG